MILKTCELCEEFKDGKCHEMWDTPIEKVSECPFGYESDLEEITEKTKNLRVDHGTTGTKHKEDRKPKTVKVSNEKQELFQYLATVLTEKYGDSVKIAKENKLFELDLGENAKFKVDIIQSRTKRATK